MRPSRFTPEVRFVALALAAFVVVQSVALSRHELWRDELQAWLIVKDLPSLGAVFHQLHYEGHPPLWYLLLRWAADLTRGPWPLKAIALVASTASAFIVLAYAPFRRTTRVALLFGYFFVYEYGVISRDYTLALPLLLSLCALYPRRSERFIAISIVTAVLLLTNVHAALVGASFFGVVVWERARARESRKQLAQGIALVVVAAVTSWVMVRPAADLVRLYDATPSYSGDRFARLAKAIAFAIVPLPHIGLHFHESSLIGDSTWLAVGVVAMTVVIAYQLLRSSTPALVFAVISSTLLALFSFFVIFGWARHHGFFFVTLVMAAWIAATNRPASSVRIAIGTSLAAHVVTAIVALSLDFLFPFSNAERAAAFIRSSEYREAPIVGDLDASMISLSGYLERPIYSARLGRPASFMVCSSERKATLDDSELLRAARSVRDDTGRAVVVARQVPLVSAQLAPLAEFEGAIDPFENYFLYVLR